LGLNYRQEQEIGQTGSGNTLSPVQGLSSWDVKVTAECHVVTHVFELNIISPPSILAENDDISITSRLRSVV